MTSLAPPVLAAPTLTPTPTISATLCSTVLPLGVEVLPVSIPNAPVLTLLSEATIIIDCAAATAMPSFENLDDDDDVDPSSIGVDLNAVLKLQDFEFRDKFHASTFPICYALASSTVVAWMLVAILFVTKRVLLDGGIVYLGRWSFKNGAGGVPIGDRPWLQKIAVFLVAVVLTIASVDTFRIVKSQYTWGIQNAALLQQEVMGGAEIKTFGILADTALWLAQAQTLIRLFPRHRDKVLIKWAAFALIVLDTLFSALNSSMGLYNGAQGNSRPKRFVEPISTLSYLLHLALGLLYAGWVMYKAFTKRKYAFYHTLMKNMCLLAAMSLTAVLTPVVFFILDISKPDVAGWSEYVRWVGAAAASVVVWEWVERIEELEREEKKGGILGREMVDDDDETPEVRAAKMRWLKRIKERCRSRGKPDDGGDGDGDGSSQTRWPADQPRIYALWPGVTSSIRRRRNAGPTTRAADQATAQDADARRGDVVARDGRSAPSESGGESRGGSGGEALTPLSWPMRPSPDIGSSLGQRTDSPSTQYTVVRNQRTEWTARTPDVGSQFDGAASYGPPSGPYGRPSSPPGAGPNVQPPPAAATATTTSTIPPSQGRPGRPGTTYAAWSRGPPFRTQGPATALAQQNTRSSQDWHSRPAPHDIPSRWDLPSRVGNFIAQQAERIRDRVRPPPSTDSLPVIVIPAPPRDGEALAQAMEELDRESGPYPYTHRPAGPLPFRPGASMMAGGGGSEAEASPGDERLGQDVLDPGS